MREKEQWSSFLLDYDLFILFTGSCGCCKAELPPPPSEQMSGLVTCQEFVLRPPGRDRRRTSLYRRAPYRATGTAPSSWGDPSKSSATGGCEKKHSDRGETITPRRNTRNDTQDTAQQTQTHKTRRKHFDDLKAKTDTHSKSSHTTDTHRRCRLHWGFMYAVIYLFTWYPCANLPQCNI